MQDIELTNNEIIDKALKERINNFKQNLKEYLANIPQNLQDEKNKLFYNEMLINQQNYPEYSEVLDDCLCFNDDFDDDFYHEKYKAKETELKDKKNYKKALKSYHNSLTKSIYNEWSDIYNKKLSNWQEQEKLKKENDFIKKLKDWLKFIKSLINISSNLGMNDDFKNNLYYSLASSIRNGEELDKYINHNFGNGCGLEEALNTLNEFLEFIESESIKKLCDKLGSLEESITKTKKHKEMFQKSFSQNIPIPSKNKAEITGITLDNKIENIVPSELALLGGEFEIVFDLKYVEKRLLCFESVEYEKIEGLEDIEIEVEKQESDKGPMILCVDFSGSMSGECEHIAKAVTLYMAKQAMNEKRECYIITFSTNIKTIHLSKNATIFDVISILQMNCSGGTDPFIAIKHAIKKLKEDSLKKADILMISDFVFNKNDKNELLKLLENEQYNKIYALYLGYFQNSVVWDKIFNEEFIYNLNTNDIEELGRDLIRLNNHY
ncbi:VWA domain-containing protein [Campylobacter sp. RM12642]|uniref:VWA domain-containing protein n=1 Tax=unclassified Campylobacter TaxID=2593542 RepID=UPI001D78A889|nr:VWA domain-containing protein [Campylobacter sp. RM12642]MBZ8008085.1 VWA domain-containing protein [Campylobacter sp. RM9334]